MTKLHDLNAVGQSVWLDYIRRQFIEDGGLQRVVDEGVRGVTSNPSIFEKAIAGSSDYDAAMKPLVDAGKSTAEIYDALVIEDIQRAADVLRPIYDESNGVDGYVSLEVSPTLAHDTEGTIADGRRYFAAVNRPNVMIKVPATPAGIPAIEALIADGININVTLMFNMQHYDDVAFAYIRGLEKLAQTSDDLSKVNSVASFFVSRVESAVDKALEEKGNTELLGTIAVANSRLAYARFEEVFSGERWDALASKGARVQRPLWASTGTKNAAYSDVKYVDELVGPHTVNTMPPATRDAVLDHGATEVTVRDNVDTARAQIAQLADLGIDLDAITQELQDDGVDKFAKSFESLMASIEEKKSILAEGFAQLELAMGEYTDTVKAGFDSLRDNSIMKRIWEHDHTVWVEDDPTEITNRLGWLLIAENMKENVDRMQHLKHAVERDGYTNVLLLGMGGSSLAPEVFSYTFSEEVEGLKLDVLDSTDPGAVLAYDEALDLSKTLFIVATKSGGTAETLSFFKYFYNRVASIVGKENAGAHFIGITDPGSKLEGISDRYHFRALFLNDPNIGGRYSALSYFGLVPAALIGVDLNTLLERATTMATNCSADNCPSAGDNNGGRLGAVMGELAKQGRDKITLIPSPAISHFGDWVEQLIAESTGKIGKGIVPVVSEPVGAPDSYGNDRVFAYMRLKGDDTYDAAVQALQDAGHPVVRLHLDDKYDLGGQFFLWEMATAVAGHILGIHPFDQPNVESAKNLARKMIAEYQETGKLPAIEPTLEADGITVYGNVDASSAAEALTQFIAKGADGAYISIQAFIQPTDTTSEALETLREKLRLSTKYATTLGYGPRFLHSTGQLHKGDGGNGLFIQLTADMPNDADIPDEAGEDASGMTFGTLKDAQALGDREALLEANRHVIRFHFSDIAAGLQALTDAV